MKVIALKYTGQCGLSLVLSKQKKVRHKRVIETEMSMIQCCRQQIFVSVVGA